MQAIVITQPGSPEVLQLEERQTPVPKAKEVLIDVRAAGVNRPDIFQRKGNYPAPDGIVADIPGLEVAGIVVSIGDQVRRWKVGDKVCCLVAGGGYATRVTADEDMCLSVPAGLSFSEAAALPETVYTVWDNVFRRGKLKGGEGLLVHGGSGGIGSTAIQLAKAFGAAVYTTVGSAEKAEFCRHLGADVVINYRTNDFYEALKMEKIHVVLDSIGGDYFERNIELLAPDGRLVYINAMKGQHVSLSIVKMMQKRISITGSTLRARDLVFKQGLTSDVLRHVWPIVGTAFRPQIYKEIPLEEAAQAHHMMESGDVFGKIVLVN
ncbi:NAD(P)H-quinone oxidoreductase [Sphingobacterium suaedae]|uniref:NAD(P)H-quinone oxidoreductase n=1 Tax=Sphingobacterium suaedae TaxID=1686402 RepID=A0ABW5KEM3_9SPHI